MKERIPTTLLTGTCPACLAHKVLVGCGRCVSLGRQTFMCYECMKEKHVPECQAQGGLCDFCPSSHPLIEGEVHTLACADVANNPEAYADTVWDLMAEDRRAMFAGQRQAIWDNCIKNARTQIVSMPNQFFGHQDGTVELVTLDCDSAMTDWGVCTKAFEVWTKNLAARAEKA